MSYTIVTGAAGFIGCNIARRLAASGSNVIAVDRLGSDNRWRNLLDIELADYWDADALFPQLNKIAYQVDAFVHMGASSATTELDAGFLMRNNFEYSKKCFEWCQEAGVKIIYASSAATYGDGMLGYADEEEEIGQLRPLNPYGWSKQLFDVWQLKQQTRPPQVVGLKFFNVYGPYESHKNSMASVLLHAFNSLKKGEDIKLFKSHKEGYADGQQMRDFIYIEDVVDIVEHLLSNAEIQGIFNVGTGQARSFADLAKSVCNAMDVEERIQYIDMPEGLRQRYQYFTEATVDKLRSTGWRSPFTTLENGAREYVRFLNKFYV